MLYGRQEFENYAQRFTAQGDTRIAQESTGRRIVSPNFVIDDSMIAEFKEHLKANRVRLDENAFKKDQEFIRAMIRFRIDEAVFGIAEARRHLIAVDPQAQLAMTMFPEAERLPGVVVPTARVRNAR